MGSTWRDGSVVTALGSQHPHSGSSQPPIISVPEGQVLLTSMGLAFTCINTHTDTDIHTSKTMNLHKAP